MEKELNQALFGHLLMSLAQSALLGMGKIVHPSVGKAEVDLEAAQQAIDMLEMLQERTKGNLSPEEERGLTQTLSMLQMNFVETAQAQPAPVAAPAAAPEATPPPAPDIVAGPDDHAPKGEGDEKVRFRKSYG
jgi:hypothetical protein